MGKIMMNGKQYGVGGITDASDVKYGSTNVGSALDALNNDLTPRKIDISGVTWSVNVNTNYTWFYKIGRIVFFQIYISDTITTNTNVGTLPSELHTLQQEWFVASPSNGGNNTCRASINTNGVVSIVLASSGVSVAAPYIKGAYIAAS